MIKIPGVARPRPSPDSDAGSALCIFESRSTAIPRYVAKEGIARGVLVIQRARLLGCIFLEDILHRNAFARRGPHVCYVKVFRPVIVVVKPADAHPGADILDSGLRSDVSKSSVAVVAVKILSSKIIHHVKVGPAIAVEVVPPATKAITRVVPVETRLGGYIAKRSVPIVAHHKIGRPILRVIIRRRILVLIRALVIDVEAEIDIQPAVAVIICNRRPSEGPLRRLGELKCVRLLAKL